MTDIEKLHEKWLQNPAYRQALTELEPEFELASQLLEARQKASLNQKELAARMKTSQSVISRIERGNQNVTVKMLHRFAEATGTKLELRFTEK